MRDRAWWYGAWVAAGASLLLASAPARSQTAPSQRADESSRDGSREAAPGVARAIAERWRVEPERVRISWLDGRGAADHRSPISVRPAGDARGEGWLVTFADGEGPRRARAGVWVIEAHAARDIARGATLGAADIAADTVVRWGAPGESEAPAAAGWVAHSAIVTGALLRAPAVTPPPAVHAGDTVQVVWRGAGVVASARGRAAATVAPGGSVPVRLDNGQRVEGRAIGAGRVLVP